jgi:phosphopantothenoylcysteine decarboxylase/phosphopantothenate--cysteine ligase
MLAACEAALPADVAVCVAAVADSQPGGGRLGQDEEGRRGPAARFPAGGDRRHPRHPVPEPGRPALVIGFAAETETVEDHALGRSWRARAGFDCDQALTTVSRPGVMGGTENTVSIVTRDGVERWEEAPKAEVARRLAGRTAAALSGGAA